MIIIIIPNWSRRVIHTSSTFLSLSFWLCIRIELRKCLPLIFKAFIKVNMYICSMYKIMPNYCFYYSLYKYFEKCVLSMYLQIIIRIIGKLYWSVTEENFSKSLEMFWNEKFSIFLRFVRVITYRFVPNGIQ